MRRTFGVISPLIFLLAATALAAPEAEPVTITGRVLNAATDAPIVSALVRVEGTRHGTVTDAAGTYMLRVPRTDLEGAKVRIQAALIGFGSETVEVDLPPEAMSRLEVDIRLHAQALRMQEAVVTGVTVAPTTFSDASMARPMMPLPHPDWNREQYALIDENAFRSPALAPLSTFSIDVDRASYSNVRRFLNEKSLPPADAVQVEEMINYFPYDYALPDAEHPVALTTEVGEAPWTDGHRLLRIGLASTPIDTADMPPNNLVFLIDVSGSMMPPDRLPLVKRSLRLLIEELRPIDRVGIVVYAGAAGLVLESTPGSEKERILDAIERLEAGGSTAGGAGLQLAYQVAEQNYIERGNNRVILATDGDFNVGESSDAAMVRLIRELSERGTDLTILGFGTRNLQFEKMQLLAHNGNGNHHYIDSLVEARKALVEEMGGTLLTVAEDVKLQVEFNPARVRAYRLIGYESRLLADEDFEDDEKDAGDLGAGHRVTALYEIVPIDAESDVEVRGQIPLRYRDTGRLSDDAATDEFAFVRVRYREPRGDESRLLEQVVNDETGTVSEDFTFASAVAGFGMLLRESEHRGDITAEQVLEMAAASLGADPHGYREGFLEMVRQYRALVEAGAVAGDPLP